MAKVPELRKLIRLQVAHRISSEASEAVSRLLSTPSSSPVGILSHTSDILRRVLGSDPADIPLELLLALHASLSKSPLWYVNVICMSLVPFIGLQAVDVDFTPKALFRAAIASYSFSKISLSSTSATDGLLRALANSSCASTLTSLSATESYLSDRTANLWNKFSNLSSLKLSGETLTMDSYREVLQLQSLTNLEISPAQLEDINSLLTKAIQQLSSLERFCVDDHQLVSTFYNEISPGISLLQSLKENPTLCVSLREINWPQFSTEDALMLAPLCTNLIKLPASFDSTNLRTVGGLLPYLEELELDVGDVFQRDVEWLASTFPRLHTLKLTGEYNTISAESFAALSSLTELKIYFGENHCTQFPPSLKNLTLYFGHTTVGSFDDLFAAVAQQLPNLTSLWIDSQETYMSQRQLEAILKGCPKLSVVNWGLVDDNDDGEPFIISHPKLTVVSFDGTRTITTGFLPKQISSEWTPTLRAALGERRLDCIETIQIESNEFEDVDLLSLLPSLRELGCGSISAEQAIALPHLSRLDHLTFRDCTIDEESLDQIISKFPILDTLFIVQHSPLLHLKWLRCLTLTSFGFSMLRDSEEELLVSEPLLFEVGPDALPCLMSIDLSVRDVAHVIFNVSSLQNLEYLHFAALGENPIGLELQALQLPELVSVSLFGVKLSQMRLEALPTLHSLGIRNCEFASGLQPSLAMLDALETLTISDISRRSNSTDPCTEEEEASIIATLNSFVRPPLRSQPSQTTSSSQ